MSLFQGKERATAAALARLAGVNPFLPERIRCEQEVLGAGAGGGAQVWSVEPDRGGANPNLAKLERAAQTLADAARKRLAAGARGAADELRDYEEVVFYLLYARASEEWRAVLDADAAAPRPVRGFERFAAEAAHYFDVPGLPAAPQRDAAFLYAFGYQTRRAFHYVFRQIFGASLPAAKLRADVWHSIFTRDRARYRRALVERMQDWSTLVTGASGTGKELVARAIGLSRFIPFDARAQSFTRASGAGFFALNLSALSPTLIESELFGHRRGAFTGAVEDREGWLEACGGGSVFLDEIGELDAALQVKLLRVLQTRAFQRLGETRERAFAGKLLAATNRDLSAEIARGAFREDLYYRICSDVIRTPSLREQLDDHPRDLHNLVLVIARRLYADEGDAVAAEVEEWIARSLPADYAWPGNVRELEQCVRNVVVRGAYEPRAGGAARAPERGPRAELAAAVAAGALDTETLLSRYATLVYHQTGSYEEAARRLGIDRRTVKARVDAALLARLEAEKRR